MSDQTGDKPEILVVDDSKVIRRAAAKMLGDGYIVHEAVDGSHGWQLIQDNDAISVVFSDMQMPVMDGIQLLGNIRNSEDERIANLPVIMITGHGDTEAAKREVFDNDATDFIAKPFESIDLLSRAKSYARLVRKVSELEKETIHDKLTGLNNASSFDEQGARALSFALRHKLCITTVLVEIHDFQSIFLTNGKNVAQQIIAAVGNKLGLALRTEDVAGRVGVARFGIFLPMTNHVNSRVLVNRILETAGKLVFDTGTQKIKISLAAGISTAELGDEIDFSEIMQQTANALEKAHKKSGEKIASYTRKAPVKADLSAPDEDEIHRAFKHIQSGNFHQIPERHMQIVFDRLMPFVKFVQDMPNDK